MITSGTSRAEIRKTGSKCGVNDGVARPAHRSTHSSRQYRGLTSAPPFSASRHLDTFNPLKRRCAQCIRLDDEKTRRCLTRAVAGRTTNDKTKYSRVYRQRPPR